MLQLDLGRDAGVVGGAAARVDEEPEADPTTCRHIGQLERDRDAGRLEVRAARLEGCL